MLHGIWWHLTRVTRHLTHVTRHLVARDPCYAAFDPCYAALDPSRYMRTSTMNCCWQHQPLAVVAAAPAVHQPLELAVVVALEEVHQVLAAVRAVVLAAVHQPLALRAAMLAWRRRKQLQHQPLAVQHPRRHPRSIHHPAYYYLHMLPWRTSRWRCSKQHKHQPVAVQHQRKKHQHQPLAVQRLCLSPRAFQLGQQPRGAFMTW